MTAISDIPPALPSRLSRLKKFAPFLIFGPISGPLAAAMVFHFRGGRPVLASLYGIAIVEIAIALPYVTTALGLRLL